MKKTLADDICEERSTTKPMVDAFPHTFENSFSYAMDAGLSKREYFAAKMMQAMMGNNEALNAAEDVSEVAIGAVKAADALIDALNKEFK